MGKALILISVVLFAVAFVLVLVGGHAEGVQLCTIAGLGTFAAGLIA